MDEERLHGRRKYDIMYIGRISRDAGPGAVAGRLGQGSDSLAMHSQSEERPRIASSLTASVHRVAPAAGNMGISVLSGSLASDHGLLPSHP